MSLTQDQIRALDQMRQRLSQLYTSITALRVDLDRNEPLPTWPSLQSSAQALSFNLQQLMETMNGHRQFLKEAHAYPLTNFPGHKQEDTLGLLLRKKLEPGVEDWIEDYTTKFEEKNEAPEGGLSTTELKELWTFAGPTSASIIGPMLEEDGAMEDDFTIAEREGGVENVVTGLRRKLDGGDSEDEDEVDEEDEEGDKMEDVMPAVPKDAGEKGVDSTLPPKAIDEVLKFVSTGRLPATTRPNG